MPHARQRRRPAGDLAHAEAGRAPRRCCCWCWPTPLAWWLARTRSRWRGPVRRRGGAAAGAAAHGAGLLPAGGARPAGPGRPARRRRWAWDCCPSPSAAWCSARSSTRCPSRCSRCSTPSRRSARGRWKPRRPCAPGRWTPSSTWRCRWRAAASCTAAVLSFAHTVGEFGVVLMIGGNIPEQTRVRLDADLRPRRGAGVHAGALAVGGDAGVLLRRAAGAGAAQPAQHAGAGMSDAHSRSALRLRARAASRSTSTCACPPAASPRSSGPRARARPPCCAASPGWSAPPSARVVDRGRDLAGHAPPASSCPRTGRPLGYVFQEASLFDHLDVRGNLAFAQRRARRRAAPPAAAAGAAGHRARCWIAGRTSSRAASASASPSRARWRRSRASCCWTSRWPRSTWRAGARSCPGWSGCATSCASRCCTSRTRPTRSRAWPTTWCCWRPGRVRAAGPLARDAGAHRPAAVPGEEAGALLRRQVAERDARWHLARVDFDGGALWLPDAGLHLRQRGAGARAGARRQPGAAAARGAAASRTCCPAWCGRSRPGRIPRRRLVQLACGAVAAARARHGARGGRAGAARRAPRCGRR